MILTLSILAVWALSPVWLKLYPECRSDRYDGIGTFQNTSNLNFKRIKINGPFRERYLIKIHNTFTEWKEESYIKNGFLYYRSDRLGRLIDVTYGAEISINNTADIVSGIHRGITIDDVYFPPPPELVAAVEASKAEYGPYPPRDATGKIVGDTGLRFEDCDVMRAAILKDPEASEPPADPAP